MKTELIQQLSTIQKFFSETAVGKNLNSAEEILFTLIQLMDIRDDEIITDRAMERLQLLTERRIEEIEPFFELYFIQTATFIGGFIQLFLENLENPDALNPIVEEVSTALANQLSEKKITLLLQELDDKILALKMGDALDGESILTQLFNSIKNEFQFNEEEIQQVIFTDKAKAIAGLIGTVIPLIVMVGEYKQGISHPNKEVIAPINNLHELEEELTKSFRGEVEEYDDEAFSYSMTDKATCNLCGQSYAPKGIKRHINSCIDKHYPKGKMELYYLIIKENESILSDEGGLFYLHIVMKGSATLEVLDAYLRDVWLECCGHMSGFFNRKVRGKIDLKTTIKKVFSNLSKLEYTYDYGSSTNLTIELVRPFKGKQAKLMRTLTRNPQPKVVCSSCGEKKVVAVCTECLWENGGYLCKACLPKHTCEEDMLLPFVNSPRVGICAYGS